LLIITRNSGFFRVDSEKDDGKAWIILTEIIISVSQLLIKLQPIADFY